MKLGENINEKVYNVLNKNNEVITDLIAKKYSTKNEMIQEYMNLNILKNVQNIPKVVDIDIYNYIIYLEKIEGVDLFNEFVDRNYYMSEFESRNIIKNLLVILRNVRKYNINYTDIKMENIMYNTVTGIVTLIDFENNRFTEFYTPPEYLKFKSIHKNSISWSIGVLAFVLLTGLYPINKNTGKLYKKDVIDRLTYKLSMKARNFLYGCLVISPYKRFTFIDIINHDWFIDDKNDTYLNKFLKYLNIV